MKEPREGTRHVNGKLLRKLRLDRGWHIRDLAEKTGYSERNIERLEAGGAAKLQTIREIAQALEVKYLELLDDQEQPSVWSQSEEAEDNKRKDENSENQVLISDSSNISTGQRIRGIKISFGDDSPISLAMRPDFVAKIVSQAIAAAHQVVVIEIIKGSIIVVVELSEEDVLRLVEAFAFNVLERIAVEAVRLPTTTGPLADGLLKIILPLTTEQLAAGLFEVMESSGTLTNKMTDAITPTMTLTRTPTGKIQVSLEKETEDLENNSLREKFVGYVRNHPAKFVIYFLLSILSIICIYVVVFVRYKV